MTTSKNDHISTPQAQGIADGFWMSIFSRQLTISKLVWVGCGITIFLLFQSLFSVYENENKSNLLALDERNTLNSEGYAQYVGTHIAFVEYILNNLASEHVNKRQMPTQKQIDSDAKTLTGFLLQVAVADANGIVVYSSLGLPKATVSIADRPHFQAVLNSSTDTLFIGQPVVGRLSGETSLQVVKPLFTSDGRFDGVIVGSINPEKLRAYFVEQKVLQDQGVLTIIGLDGVSRFRLDTNGFSSGQSALQSDGWNEISSQPRGVLTTKSPVDGVKRRNAFQRIQGYPLVIVAGVGLDVSSAEFKARWERTSLWALVFSALLCTVAFFISRLEVAQKLTLNALNENRVRALKSNQMKSSFLASVSHELRTPLNAILGFSELIRDTGTDPKISYYADLAHKSGTQLHDLVSTILDLSKIDNGKMTITNSLVDLPKLLGTLVAIHKVKSDAKGIELSLSVVAGLAGSITVDRAKLAQVVSNVIHNAIKFTSAGAIFIVLKPAEGTGLTISVIDSGIGIDAKYLPHVFDRFSSADRPETQFEASGSGLGLALCKELLNMMGGNISISSEFGQGTTVDIYLPLHSPAQRTTV